MQIYDNDNINTIVESNVIFNVEIMLAEANGSMVINISSSNENGINSNSKYVVM